MRNYNALWFVWGSWALLVALWLADCYLQLPLAFYGLTLAGVAGLTVLAYGIFLFSVNVIRNNTMFSFDKNKKSLPLAVGENDVQERSEVSSPSTELVSSVSSVRVRKDTFISLGARLSGTIACDANMTIEGLIEGDLLCDESVKIEHSGTVKGDIRAQQVVINGVVEGRIYASAITILTQGKMVGDIFADELSIEKGGVFTGMSNPLQPGAQQEKVAPSAHKRDKVSKARVEQDNVVALADGAPQA